MEQETKKRETLPDKKFRFKFSPLMITLFCVGLALCAAGFGVNTWQFVLFLQSDITSAYDWMRYLLLYLASIFLAVLIISMLIRSQYVLTEKELIVQFGIIRSRYEIRRIFSFCKLNGSGKLAVYFDDFKTKYSVIVVKEIWYDDFILALTARNERIAVDIVSAEEEKNNKKKK